MAVAWSQNGQYFSSRMSLFTRKVVARFFAKIMSPVVKRVPIPRNGVDYRGKIVLAPMVRSGECPSRLLALKYGADLVWGPETIDRALIGTTRTENPVTKTVDFTRYSSNGGRPPEPNNGHKESIIYRLHPELEGKKLIYQIGTANPETAVEAARLIAADVAGIDVNAGCPKPFSTHGGMGAALLKTPEKLCAILRALVKEVGIPFEIGISVKIRLLDTPEETEKLVRSLCETGITGLTIHCRTTPMRPRERAIRQQLKMIVDVCHEAGVACLMNGDVASRDEALQLMTEYGADGAMIATAAETNSSVFRAESDGGKADWKEAVIEYVKLAIQVENRFGNTKYLLGQMIPGKQPEYKRIMPTRSYAEIVTVLEQEADLLEKATTLDKILEIGQFAPVKATKAERKAAAQATAEQNAEHKDHNTTGTKRSAAEAELDTHMESNRTKGPGTISEQASILAV